MIALVQSQLKHLIPVLKYMFKASVYFHSSEMVLFLVCKNIFISMVSLDLDKFYFLSSIVVYNL